MYEICEHQGTYLNFIKLYFFSEEEAIAEVKTYNEATLYAPGGEVLFVKGKDEHN